MKMSRTLIVFLCLLIASPALASKEDICAKQDREEAAGERVTHAEFVHYLLEISGLSLPETPGKEDKSSEKMSPEERYQAEVNVLTQQGYPLELSMKKMNKLVTREHFASVMARIAKESDPKFAASLRACETDGCKLEALADHGWINSTEGTVYKKEVLSILCGKDISIYSYSPYSFKALLVFGFLSIMLLTGIVLRAKVPFIQRFLFPSCLVGGLLAMVLVNAGWVPIAPDYLQLFVYHFFNVSFISVGLTGKSEDEKVSADSKTLLKGAIWMALIQGICFPMQGLIGTGFVYLFNHLGYNLFETLGFLVPMAYNEGPGQAVSIGKVWQDLGCTDAATIGITFASVGFFLAFFVGVPIANWGLRKGLAVQSPEELPRCLITGIYPPEDCEEAGRQTMHSANVESLAFQLAMVGLVYIITWFFLEAFSRLFSPADAKILWGFFFFFGLVFALLVRQVLKLAGVVRLLDGGIQRRITGWAVDYLILATVAAIELVVVVKYILPLAFISVFTGAATVLVVFYMGRRLQSYNLERTLAIYGTTTGVVSSGLLLLRIVDPDFRTQVAMELGIMNIFCVPVVVIGVLLLSMPVTRGAPMLYAVLGLAGMMVLSLVLLRLLKLWGQKKF
ncbi:MAG: sodium/glutamate symporter [bacterium]